MSDPKRTPDSKAQESQRFARRLVDVLSSKRFSTSENHWELIFGFIFFFGGIFFILKILVL